MSIYYYVLEENFPTLKKIREYKFRKHAYQIRKNIDRKIEELIQDKDDFIVRFKEFYQEERDFYQDMSYPSILTLHSSKDRLKEWINPPYPKPITIFDYPRYILYRVPHFFYPRLQEVFPYVPRRSILWDRIRHKTKTGLLYFYKTPCYMAIIGGVTTGLMFSGFMGIMRTIQRGLKPTKMKIATEVKKLPWSFFSINLLKLPRYIYGLRGVFVNVEYFIVIFGVGGVIFGCFATPFQPQYDSYDNVWDEIRYFTLGELANRNEVMRVPSKPMKFTPDAVGFMHSTLAHRTFTLLERYHEKQVAEKNYLLIEELERKEKENERARRRLERKIAINHYSLMQPKEDDEKEES